MLQSSQIILRQLLHEIRRSSYGGKLSDSLMAKHVFKQFRKYNVTDAQLCRRQDEMKFLADTYRCYLQSNRQYRQLCSQYHGKGERSVKETSDMVGFKLPNDSN